MLKNYRHNDLYNTMYKLILKIIFNRIKPFLSVIIGLTQSIILSNKRKYINHFHKMRGKSANIILKIDLEKAFDKIEWSFIRDSLLFLQLP